MDKLDFNDLDKVNGGAMSEEEIKRMIEDSNKKGDTFVLGEGFEDPLSGRERAKIITQEVVDKIKKEHDEELQKVKDPFGLNRRNTF